MSGERHPINEPTPDRPICFSVDGYAVWARTSAHARRLLQEHLAAHPGEERPSETTEDAARLEGFADCEALIIAMARAQAAALESGELKVPGDHPNAGLIASWALNSFALALNQGQHRTEQYDQDELARAHRRAGITDQQRIAGGRARQAQLTPARRQKLAKMAAAARWKKGESK